MTKHFGLFIITLAAGCATQITVPAVNLPPLAKPGTGALLLGELIYPLEGRLTPQCHASTIVQTTQGGLVAAWFAGTGEKHRDVGIRVARWVKGKWTIPVEVADGSEGEDQDFLKFYGICCLE